MAKEKKVKIKSEKDNGKLVLMIGVILIVCSVILLGISVYIMKNNTNPKEVEEKDAKVIPLKQKESYETENIVIILPSKDNPNKRMSFTFYVGFELDKKSKDLKETKTMLEESKGFIKSKISGLLSDKYSEDMLKQNSKEDISQEIFDMMNEMLDTDSLVEVYIRDFLYK
ncbi:hypothetical protein SH1V18_14570 [Vallitalea longa]|uniref:Flagellar protein FliL n=1 Tax=Vallitalea longa TaxID=2936439 RepID=A0A9W5Y8U3_9FIRM|nr:flagellar basal body-associated FliL family protein [Vallitalea longa]GKX28977.1 hypothetical protein SH1V18_14570 [Vallitalea longa]